MKKVQSSSTARGAACPPKPADVAEYFAWCPETHRPILEKLRATIRSVVPTEATEGLTYGMPCFRYEGALVAYAAFKRHCSLFPMSGSVIAEFAEEVADYKTSKGTIQFALDQPLPVTLVKKIVKARVAQNAAKKA